MKNRVREIRQEKDMTQQELADAIGVTRQTIASLENGRYSPSIVVAYRITKILGYKIIEEVFIFDEEDLEWYLNK
jgi:putative transcriptional regulator